MSQYEAGNSDHINTEIINKTNTDENCAHSESLLTKTQIKKTTNEKNEDITHTVAAISVANMPQKSENTDPMPPFPVLAAKMFTVDHGAEIATSDDNTMLSSVAITNTITTAISTPTTVVGMSQLHHVASAPMLSNVQMRANQQQQQKIKSYHDAKQTALWDTRSITSPGGTILKSGIGSVSGTPKMTRKSSGSLGTLPRRVSFPKSDKELVTGYLEPANPWEHACSVNSVGEIADLYIKSCHKHGTNPLSDILENLKVVDLNNVLRQPLLSLKETKLQPGDCEALEEILKRVQYKCIDISKCELEESAVSAIFEIIEYYEAAQELNISSNPKGLTTRGWSSCAYMVGRSQALQVLNAEGNPISRSSAECLGNALCTSNLHTVKLEHCGLKGPPLMGLCMKIRQNRILKELWLAHNDLDNRDAEHIAELLKCNHFLELVDISNNNIGDDGLKHIVEALIVQSKELERRTMFQRAAAIEDDIFSPVELTPSEEPFKSENNNALNESIQEIESNNHNNIKLEKNACALIPDLEELNLGTEIKTKETALITTNEENEEDVTEDTVKSNTIKSKTQSSVTSCSSGGGGGGGGVGSSCGGQSMLDKLLSMNSDSSSEEGASNLSTDTIAACGSEDTSFLSDDIFVDIVTTSAATTNNCTSSNVNVLPVIASNMPLISLSNESIIMSFESPLQLRQSDGKNNGSNEEIISCDTCTLEANNHGRCDENNVIAVVVGDSGGGDVDNNRTPIPTNCSTTTNNNNFNNNNNTNNNNNNNNPKRVQSQQQQNQQQQQQENETDLKKDAIGHSVAMRIDETANCSANSTVFEVTADDSDCLVPCTSHNNKTNSLIMQTTCSAAVDVNKNSRLAEDYDDTHSTDSAFESASEGDISRHLPDEFTRLSTSLDINNKELTIETATIATESTESLIESAVVNTIPKQSLSKIGTQKSDEIKTKENIEVRFADPLHSSEPNETSQMSIATAVASASSSQSVDNQTHFEYALPKVTIESESVSFVKTNEDNSPIPTPPPPSTSPGGAGLSMRRTDSSCNFMTQSMRNHSQSSDSLCSDNSLDGSVSSDLNLSTSNERFTKNDTLTRQLRQFDAPLEAGTRSPGGLKALAVWNNNLTKESGLYISDLLMDTSSLELLNIGKNILSNEFLLRIKESLAKNTTLTTLGLQSAHLSANGIETLAAILSFGGNSTLQRIDIRDNKLEPECLVTLGEALKSNTTVTQIDIDDEPKRLSVGSDAHLQYTRLIENVRSMCSRNEKTQAQLQADKTANAGGTSKRRSGYYVGSRKISLTCHSRPLIEYSVAPAVSMPPPGANKLEVKRKSGVRLRSPVPSPKQNSPTISPSSSPNRSRFQVFRVTEVSPLTSPLAQTPPPTLHTAVTTCNNSNSVPTLSTSVDSQQRLISSLSSSSSSSPSASSSSSILLTTSASLPSMATATSSTQTIKRPSSNKSRFHVSKIYEDPKVPLSKRFLPPITPPIHLPPSPMLKSAPKNETTAFEDKPNEKENDFVNSNNSTLTALNSALSNSAIHINTNSDVDSIELGKRIQSVRCPIAVFNENDITLTHDSANEIRLTAATVVTSSNNANNQKTNLNVNVLDECSGINDNKIEDKNPSGISLMQPVARKMSCPTAVDKLLTLFNPVTIFQRSTSPEPQKQSIINTTTTVNESTNSTSEAIPTATPASTTTTTAAQNSVVSTLKQSPPTWSKLGSDILNLSVGETEKAIEHPRSFLDAASKQLRDFSKQVFRQNPTVATVSSTVNTEEDAKLSEKSNTEVELLQPESTNIITSFEKETNFLIKNDDDIDDDDDDNNVNVSESTNFKITTKTDSDGVNNF